MQRKMLRLILVLCMAAVLGAPACGEQASEEAGLTWDTWMWDEGNVNQFEGFLDLKGRAGENITLRVEADFTPAAENTAAPRIVVAGGKRISMMNQSDSVPAAVPEDGDLFSFSCSLTMPEGHFSAVTLKAAALDASGEEIARTENTVYVAGYAPQSGNVYYIPFEVRTLAMIIAGAAVAVWAAAVVLNRRAAGSKHRS